MNDKNKSELLQKVELLEARCKATEDRLVQAAKAVSVLTTLKEWVIEEYQTSKMAARDHALKAVCGTPQQMIDSTPQAKAYNTRAEVFGEIKNKILGLEGP